MANIVEREQAARTPIGDFVNGTANNPEATVAEKTALEATLTHGSYVARVRTYTGQTKYGIVTWFLDNKPFTTYKSKNFVTTTAQEFLQKMIDIKSGADAPTGVAVSPKTSSGAADSTVQLTATVSPATANQGVRWTTSDATKATVSSTGLVTRVATGSATITATSLSDLSLSDTATITIT